MEVEFFSSFILVLLINVCELPHIWKRQEKIDRHRHRHRHRHNHSHRHRHRQGHRHRHRHRHRQGHGHRHRHRHTHTHTHTHTDKTSVVKKSQLTTSFPLFKEALSVNALCACVYIYIRHLSSFRAPTLWFLSEPTILV